MAVVTLKTPASFLPTPLKGLKARRLHMAASLSEPGGRPTLRTPFRAILRSRKGRTATAFARLKSASIAPMRRSGAEASKQGQHIALDDEAGQLARRIASCIDVDAVGMDIGLQDRCVAMNDDLSEIPVVVEKVVPDPK